jgi:hypothetical protein
MIKLILVISCAALSVLLFFLMVLGLVIDLSGCAICDNDPPSYISAVMTVLTWGAVQYFLWRIIRFGWTGDGWRS